MAVKPIYADSMKELKNECNPSSNCDQCEKKVTELETKVSDLQKQVATFPEQLTDIQFGTETRTVKEINTNYGYVDLVFTEVLNHNQQGKTMFVCTDALREDGTSLFAPEPPKGEFYNIANRYTHLDTTNGNISISLNREISNYPFDIKFTTDKQELTSNSPYVSIRKETEGFVATVNSPPEDENQTLAFNLSPVDKNQPMTMTIEYPDGNSYTYFAV